MIRVGESERMQLLEVVYQIMYPLGIKELKLRNLRSICSEEEEENYLSNDITRLQMSNCLDVLLHGCVVLTLIV